MRISKVLVGALPLVLAGCHDFLGEDSDNFYAPPPSPVAAAPATAAPKPTPPAHEECGCPDKSTAPLSSAAAFQPAAVSCVPSEDPAWFPSEGHLVHAGDLVMELKRSKHGINPSHEEMVQHLQANMKRFPGMSVTATQAEKVLEELGV